MSDGLFLLLLVAVGFGVRQLTLALPIPEEVVRQYTNRQRERELEPTPAIPDKEDDDSWSGRRTSHHADDDDDWLHGDGVNIDGTPMHGDLDIYGNPFGITNDSW